MSRLLAAPAAKHCGLEVAQRRIQSQLDELDRGAGLAASTTSSGEPAGSRRFIGSMSSSYPASAAVDGDPTTRLVVGFQRSAMDHSGFGFRARHFPRGRLIWETASAKVIAFNFLLITPIGPSAYSYDQRCRQQHQRSGVVLGSGALCADDIAHSATRLTATRSGNLRCIQSRNRR